MVEAVAETPFYANLGHSALAGKLNTDPSPNNNSSSGDANQLTQVLKRKGEVMIFFIPK